MQQIVILGGGAAGLAAALAAAQSAPAGAVRVTVLDRNPRCGKKLLATGNGRCNLDNTGIAPEQYFTADPAALRPLLAARKDDVLASENAARPFDRARLHVTAVGGRECDAGAGARPVKAAAEGGDRR